jgi:hypothetical protein
MDDAAQHSPPADTSKPTTPAASRPESAVGTHIPHDSASFADLSGNDDPSSVDVAATPASSDEQRASEAGEGANVSTRISVSGASRLSVGSQPHTWDEDALEQPQQQLPTVPDSLQQQEQQQEQQQQQQQQQQEQAPGDPPQEVDPLALYTQQAQQQLQHDAPPPLPAHASQVQQLQRDAYQDDASSSLPTPSANGYRPPVSASSAQGGAAV